MAKRFALIIGNRIYRDPALTRLSTPDVDIGDLADILLDPEIGRFDDAKTLVNMSTARVRREISEFLYHKNRDDLLLLYFSGHGVLDDRGQLYLALKDTELPYLRSTAIPSAFLTDEMDNSRSRRQLLILDCCHSGAFARGTKGTPGANVGTAAAFEGSGYGRIILTASDATQYAFEGDQILGETDQSFFTHYLVRGLKTGEADLDEDGQITIDELYDYTFDRMTQQTVKQKPKKWSYNVEGEMVIAMSHQRITDTSPGYDRGAFKETLAVKLEGDLDRRVAARLAELYRSGLSAFWLKEWEAAARTFQTIINMDPDYEDAATKLEVANTQLLLIKLYEQAQTAMEAEDWAAALTALQEIDQKDPNYRDVVHSLEQVQRRTQLAELYSEAQALHVGEHWQAVVNLFSRIAEIDPDYADPAALLASAQESLAVEARQAELNSLYLEAFTEMDAGHWETAQKLLKEVQTLEPGYEQTEELMSRIEAELGKEEENRQRQAQIAELYDQAERLGKLDKWPQVIEKIDEIRVLDDEFSDPKGLAESAWKNLREEEAKAKYQKETEEMYSGAVRLLTEGKFEAALQQHGKVRERDPKYPDPQKVEYTARIKLRSSEMASQPKPRRSKWLLIMGTGTGLVGIGIFLVAIMIITNLIVKAQNDARDARLAAEAIAYAHTLATGTSIAEKTQAAFIKETERAQGNATATAVRRGNLTATAQAIIIQSFTPTPRPPTPTRTPVPDTPTPSSSLVMGPLSGDIFHEPEDGTIEIYPTDLSLYAFVAEVTFFNPYALTEGAWDYGFYLRSPTHIIRVLSNLDWVHNEVIDDEYFTRESGSFNNLRTGVDQSNQLRLIKIADHGLFYINDEFVAYLDLAGLNKPFKLEPAIGMTIGNEYEGELTHFENFKVWALDDPLYGPEEGSIFHEPEDGLIEKYYSGIKLDNFVAEATFYNPYSPSEAYWSHGIFIDNPDHLFALNSNGKWLYSILEDGEWTNINWGVPYEIWLEKGQSNNLILVVIGDHGALFVNNQFVGDLILSTQSDSLPITLTHTAVGIPGGITNFDNFSIWSLD